MMTLRRLAVINILQLFLSTVVAFEMKYFEEIGTVSEILENLNNVHLRKDILMTFTFLHKNKTILDYIKPASNPDNFYNVYHEDKTYARIKIPRDFNYTNYILNTNVNATNEDGNLFFHYSELKLQDDSLSETVTIKPADDITANISYKYWMHLREHYTLFTLEDFLDSDGALVMSYFEKFTEALEKNYYFDNRFHIFFYENDNELPKNQSHSKTGLVNLNDTISLNIKENGENRFLAWTWVRVNKFRHSTVRNIMNNLSSMSLDWVKNRDSRLSREKEFSILNYYLLAVDKFAKKLVSTFPTDLVDNSTVGELIFFDTSIKFHELWRNLKFRISTAITYLEMGELDVSLELFQRIQNENMNDIKSFLINEVPRFIRSKGEKSFFEKYTFTTVTGIIVVIFIVKLLFKMIKHKNRLYKKIV